MTAYNFYIMNILKTVKKNPSTTVIAIITAITNVWNLLSENAELFGISSKAIAIGTVVLTAIMLVFNSFNSQE